MKSIQLLVLVCISVLLVNCSSKVYVQRDESANLAKYKTYSWVQTKADENDNRNTTAFAEETIHNIVREELTRQGWKEVSQDPDVLLSYDILVERSTQQQSDPVYSQPMTRVYYNPYLRRWGTIYYPSRFVGYDTYETPVREGTLTLTMADANTDKTIWQAWTTDQLSTSRYTTQEIRKNVRNILKKL